MKKQEQTNKPSQNKEVIRDYDTDWKIKHAIRLIKSANSQRDYTVAFSGGKDSVVLSWLTKEAGLKLRHAYNLTTIDPKGTIAFVKRMGAEIIKPKETFLELVEKRGFPTMFRRFCCKELKEQFISPYLMTGVRKNESVKRAKNYCSFEDVYNYTKKIVSVRLHPMLYFTSEDIEYIINEHQLECHPLYYDEQGKFCVERRLGCLGCPLQGDRGKADFKQYPKLLASIAKRGIRFHEAHGRTDKDAYENLVYNLFYSNHGYDKYQQTYNGLFHYDAKEFLEQQFNIKLP